jgi:hypothetical protein
MKSLRGYHIVDCCENCKHSKGTRNLPPYHCLLLKMEISMTGICDAYSSEDHDR